VQHWLSSSLEVAAGPAVPGQGQPLPPVEEFPAGSRAARHLFASQGRASAPSGDRQVTAGDRAGRLEQHAAANCTLAPPAMARVVVDTAHRTQRCLAAVTVTLCSLLTTAPTTSNSRSHRTKPLQTGSYRTCCSNGLRRQLLPLPVRLLEGSHVQQQVHGSSCNMSTSRLIHPSSRLSKA